MNEASRRVAKLLAGTNSAFVLHEKTTGLYLRANEVRCGKRFTPFSTFKIPNSLIGLETGAIADPDAVLPWDQKAYPPQDHWPEGWKRGHSLRTAFKASAVWWYQDLAKRIGPERMTRYLKRFGYGNESIRGGIDRFWLGSSLTISANEQVEFLNRFLDGKLGLSPETTATARDLFVYEKTPTYTLSAKTGGGPTGPGKALGWFVGYVETGGKVYVFALNTDGPSYAAIKDKRIELTKGALRAVGAIPEAP